MRPRKKSDRVGRVECSERYLGDMLEVGIDRRDNQADNHDLNGVTRA